MPEEPQKPLEFGPEINWRLGVFWFLLFCASLAVSALTINQMFQIATDLIK